MTDFPQTDTPQAFMSQLKQLNVRYVLVSPPLTDTPDTSLDDYLARDVLTWIEKNPLSFRRIFRDDKSNVTVFELSNQ